AHPRNLYPRIAARRTADGAAPGSHRLRGWVPLRTRCAHRKSDPAAETQSPRFGRVVSISLPRTHSAKASSGQWACRACLWLVSVRDRSTINSVPIADQVARPAYRAAPTLPILAVTDVLNQTLS